jgi:SMI1 / KNR4 family (SUKH-1)
MTKYDEQIKRIKAKLLEAKKADKKFEVFGANRHQYHLNEPASEQEIVAFEKKYNIQLPECYRAFVSVVGNGGMSSSDSGAGPFYGIYPLDGYVDELVYDNAELYLQNKCVIYPKMPDDYWTTLNENIEDNEDISDENYDKELGKIYGGMMPLGSQGCSFLHAIVLNGEYCGRIVNLSLERNKPNFAFENNFLDWYERWLDEVIAGELTKDAPAWFGYTIGGSEEDLMTSFATTNDLERKNDILTSLLEKKVLKEATLSQIEHLIPNDIVYRTRLIQILCKSNYEKAKPYLLVLIHTHLLSVLQFIYWYAKDKSRDWTALATENAVSIKGGETFRYYGYLLEAAGGDYGHAIQPFTKNTDVEIRKEAFSILGRMKNKKDYLDCFIEGLYDTSNEVVRTTLYAISDIKDEKLIVHYQVLLEKMNEEQDYILENINYSLMKQGLSIEILLMRSKTAQLQKRNEQTVLDTILQTVSNQKQKKKWYEIWK